MRWRSSGAAASRRSNSTSVECFKSKQRPLDLLGHARQRLELLGTVEGVAAPTRLVAPTVGRRGRPALKLTAVRSRRDLWSPALAINHGPQGDIDHRFAHRSSWISAPSASWPSVAQAILPTDLQAKCCLSVTSAPNSQDRYCPKGPYRKPDGESKQILPRHFVKLFGTGFGFRRARGWAWNTSDRPCVRRSDGPAP